MREALEAHARARGGHRVAGADVAGARQLGADLEALPAAGGRRRRIRRWRPASTGRSPSSTSSTGPSDGEGETHLRRSLELDPHNRRSGYHFERLLREKGSNDELLTLYIGRADRAANRDERALAEVAAAELCEQDEPRRSTPTRTSARRWTRTRSSRARCGRARRADARSRSGRSWARCWRAPPAASAASRTCTLLIELATLIWKRLNQPDMAESFFRRVRKLDASNHPMVEFYREYYTAKNELPQLLTILAQAQKTEGDVDRRVAMGIEMARAAEKRPQHAEKAIEIWKGILRLKPHLPEAVTSLRALYTRTEKWNALLELLKDDLDAVPATDVDEKINRYLEIVAIYRDRLNLDVMVVNTYLNILALKPDHPAALAALASRYEAQGRYGDLVQVLTRQAEAAKDPAERVALHRRIAALWADKLGKHGNAIASFEKIFESDPTDAETSGRLKDLYTKGRAWRPLIEVYRKELPHLDAGGAAGAPDRDGARRGRSAERRARGDRALQPGAGRRGARRRRADGAGDAVRSRAALAGADRGAGAAAPERGRPEGRRGRAGAARTPRRRCSTTGWARRRRRSTSSSASRSCSRRTRARRGRCARSTRTAGDYASLESLYAEHGAFGDLCDQLTSLADRTADMAARTRLLERVALIAQEKLNQPERALKAYERILATDPRNRGAALALLPLYRNAQKWPRLLATYEVLLGPAAAGDGAGRPAGAATPRRARSASSAWGRRRWRSSGARARSRRRPRTRRCVRISSGWPARPTSGATWRRSTTARTAATTDAEERLWLLRRTLRIASTRLFRPLDARKAAEAILAEVGFDEEADAALEQHPHADQGVGGSGHAAARARRPRARRRRARAPAVPGRAARGRARGRRRPRRPSPGRRSSRPSRTTSARCGR